MTWRSASDDPGTPKVRSDAVASFEDASGKLALVTSN
jgi:hypothetical protein